MKRAWLLNPDAEIELARLARGAGGNYSPDARARQAMEQRRTQFDDLVQGEPAFFAHEMEALGALDEDCFLLPWCPTPAAQRVVEKLGRAAPRAPATPILCAANDKTQLGSWCEQLVPGRTIVRSASEVSRIAGKHEIVRLKRPFGFAGRGQRRVTAELSPDDTRFIAESLLQGPLVVEPELDDFRLVSVHFLVRREEPIVGEPKLFHCDDFGSFVAWSGQSLESMESQLVKSEAGRASSALARAGYFGPASMDFGVLGYQQAYAIDLNARFSLGWSRGLGEKRLSALEAFSKL